MSRYQKGKTNRDFTEARDSEWQWHQLGHMQVCTSLQTDNHASTPPLCFLQAGCPSCRPTNGVKALKALKKYSCSTGKSTIYFVSAAIAVYSSHMTASSSTLWSRFSPPSNAVNGHVSTMWFMVCRWPQQEGDWARPHLCKLA